MNIHHLELFYHVARHRGISAATRKIPYGIQQPAVSGQILQLEKSRINALFADLHSANLLWTTFTQPPNGVAGDDSNYRWDPVLPP